jgi:hypothetical protein
MCYFGDLFYFKWVVLLANCNYNCLGKSFLLRGAADCNAQRARIKVLTFVYKEVGNGDQTSGIFHRSSTAKEF